MNAIPKISFIKQDSDELEFEIFTLNSLFARKDSINLRLDKPHRVDFYHILYITSGTGRHFIDFRPFSFQAGDLIFISRGQVHAFEVKPDRDGYVILFTEEFLAKNLIHADLPSLNRLYNYHLYSPVLETRSKEFAAMIAELYQEYSAAEEYAREEILRLLLKLLLLKAERIKHAQTAQHKNTGWLRKFTLLRSHVEQNYSTTRNARDYAAMLHISYKNLNEICKALTGKTAKAFIDHFVTLEIKRHLAMTNLSVKELTYALGFDEPTNLIKFFRKHTGLTPTQFRKNLQKT
ncbi:MAG TPA: helix-turn-helix domain-containing protein [Bacteroidetes bacterium]|nr:helix-turn-helix domain-containing protein [Bacteroidota bacterium]